jgi:amino acid transporter
MVGVGWLVLMDDWLQRGGPLGGILGFAIGGLLLLPIGYVYARLVMEIPDAGSEIAYTARVFPSYISFITGWTMMLAYLIVCPWEAVAIGKMAAFVFPAMNSVRLYEVAGTPVYLPTLVLGLALTGVITALNYRGIRLSATFQKWTTFGLLLLFLLFTAAALPKASAQNFAPLFSHGGIVSVLLVLQIVPYFMTGFESVPKCAEEASAGFRSRGFFRAILTALAVGVLFYIAVIAIVSSLRPWRTLLGQSFATASAFESAFGSRWIVNVILLAAVLSLLKIFNGNFIAATRLLFALGRRGLIDSRTAYIHPRNQTPGVAVVVLGILTAAAVFLGSAILVPITEVGSMASAMGWLATCCAYFQLTRARSQRAIAVSGAAVALLLIAMKVLPFVPGHFSKYEWLALALWLGLGATLRRRQEPQSRMMAGEASAQE